MCAWHAEEEIGTNEIRPSAIVLAETTAAAMMMSKAMPVGRTASKVARVVLGNTEASVQRGLATHSKKVVVSTRAGLGVQGANRLAVAQLPFRSVVAKPMGPLRRFEFCECNK